MDSKISVQLSCTEGGSRTVVESLSCGLPVIVCSDCVTNVDQVLNGEIGYVVEPNPVKLAKKIEYLLDNVEERRRMGAKAYNKMREKREKYGMYNVFRKHIVEGV